MYAPTPILGLFKDNSSNVCPSH